VQQALTDTAAPLESLVEQTLAVMNAGGRLEEALVMVRAPEALVARPYLRPVYDEPEFIVRNVWRLYGGWWDGDPSHLKPARAAHLAREIAALAGGASKLAARAETSLMARGSDPE
jgi:alkyl sulfatase BDS1-like metallo-beta-lactamase superfamily hydrolase